MSILKMGLTGLTAVGLSKKAENLVTDMTDNANFPSPQPALADITAKRVELDDWINRSSFNDIRAIEYRKSVYKELLPMLHTLAQYVSMTAQGDGSVILSAGFELKRPPSPAPPITRPVDLSVTRTAYDGQVKLDWKRGKRVLNYLVQMTSQNPESESTKWIPMAITSKSQLLISELTFGNYYYFRVKAVGNKNESPFSEVAFIRAA